MSSYWTFSAVALAGGLCLAGYTLYVWRHRRASAGHSLAVMLAAAGWWGLAYALELGSTRMSARLFWGDAKWLGIALLPVAFYAFVMQYTGRERLVTRQIMAALAVVPVATVALLAIPATHDLVRYYRPEAAADPTTAIAQVGPLFWPFLVFANLVVWGSTGVLVWTLTRLSRRYWRQSLLLIVAVLLPSLANVAHNLNLGPFGRVEATPFLFVLTGAVLVWGLFRFRLLDLAPVAQRSVFETMQDGVLVLDPYRRVVKLNPAAERALGVPGGQAVGLPVSQLLGVAPSVVEQADDPVLPEEVELGDRRFELTTTPLGDRGSGRVTGRVVELRDVTERHQAHERLVRLDEQRRWLLGRVVWAQEEERRRIAGEVHDDAIQTIAAARLMLTTFRDQLSDDYQRDLLDHLEEAVSTSLARLRTLVFDLRPAQLDDDGLAAALREYLGETAGQGGLVAELRDQLDDDGLAAALREYLAETAGQGGLVAELRDDTEREPPAEVRVIAYRICQEALTNVRVHARASRVEVRLEESRGGLLVSVTDDGEGFDPDRVRATPRRGHVGLTSMSERATMADGWCQVDSAPGQGTCVRFWLPTKDSG